jgi:hypothetical protein
MGGENSTTTTGDYWKTTDTKTGRTLAAFSQRRQFTNETLYIRRFKPGSRSACLERPYRGVDLNLQIRLAAAALLPNCMQQFQT